MVLHLRLILDFKLDFNEHIDNKIRKCNKTIGRKIEVVQYNAAFLSVGAIKGTSCNRLYKELGSEFLEDSRWSRRLFSSTKLHRDSYHLIFKLTIMLLVKERI